MVIKTKCHSLASIISHNMSKKSKCINHVLLFLIWGMLAFCGEESQLHGSVEGLLHIIVVCLQLMEKPGESFLPRTLRQNNKVSEMEPASHTVSPCVNRGVT